MPSLTQLWLKSVRRFGGFAMKTTTMKTTSLRFFGAFLALGVLAAIALTFGQRIP